MKAGFAVVLAIAACAAVLPAQTPARKHVLAWADVRNGYQHDSISHAVATIERLAEGAEIVTVLAGKEAPIPLDELDTHVPDGVEIETHDGGQPSWWWLLAAQ